MMILSSGEWFVHKLDICEGVCRVGTGDGLAPAGGLPKSTSAVSLLPVQRRTHLDLKASGLLTFRGGPQTSDCGGSLITARAQTNKQARQKPAYYSCLSSHHVCCLLPASWMDWQQMRLATRNPALQSILKWIPLSATQPTTLMCTHRAARVHAFSNCQRSHPRAQHSDTHAHARAHTQEMSVTSLQPSALSHSLWC